MTDKYLNLLSKGTIGTLETRNKTVMCAMGINQSDKGFVNDAVSNHYAERAKGGCGGCETADYLAEQGQKVTMSGRSGRE